MRIEKVNIDDLISPDYNPREITPEEMEKLKKSIQEFDYIDPIIVNDVNNRIIGGNQRYEALKSLGYSEIEVSFVHIEGPNREKALNLRLNKLSGDWNTEKLYIVLDELELNDFDLGLTGFDGFNEELKFKELVDKTEFVDKTESKPKEINDADGYVESESKPGYYQITILFDSEEEMTEEFDNLVEQGYNCRMSNS